MAKDGRALPGMGGPAPMTPFLTTCAVMFQLKTIFLSQGVLDLLEADKDFEQRVFNVLDHAWQNWQKHQRTEKRNGETKTTLRANDPTGKMAAQDLAVARGADYAVVSLCSERKGDKDWQDKDWAAGRHAR